MKWLLRFVPAAIAVAAITATTSRDADLVQGGAFGSDMLSEKAPHRPHRCAG